MLMQHILIVLIVALCAVYIGRRLYRNIRRTDNGCGCGCSCSGCETDIPSFCPSKKHSDQS
ncbi:MAG TPA: FeoB-associated Cys-rich membrane protein [Desulfobacteraceae bacterium]|nr:FeoB-associated Cys-rich membrane protein [Desulfobacteraceae bacterium]